MLLESSVHWLLVSGDWCHSYKMVRFNSGTVLSMCKPALDNDDDDDTTMMMMMMCMCVLCNFCAVTF